MKASICCFLPIAASLATAQLIVLPIDLPAIRNPTPDRGAAQESAGQVVMENSGPGPVIPDSGDDRHHHPSDDNMPTRPPPAGSVILSDVMGRDKSINIFAGFTRDVEEVGARLDNPNHNSTVLAPLNSAVEALPRKPWEDAVDYGELGEDAYEGEDGQERATRNLRRFVEAHIVPASPWAEGVRARPLLKGAAEVWWETKDGVRVVSLSLREP